MDKYITSSPCGHRNTPSNDKRPNENREKALDNFFKEMDRGHPLREDPRYPLPDRYQVLFRMQRTR